MKEYGNNTKLAGSINRMDICDLLIACTSVRFSLENEANDPNTTDERKRICLNSAKKWERLHDKVAKQLDEWDKEHTEAE